MYTVIAITYDHYNRMNQMPEPACASPWEWDNEKNPGNRVGDCSLADDTGIALCDDLPF